MSVSISNIKEDDEILKSKNELISAQNDAQSIELIGRAMRAKPSYLEKYKWDVIKEFSATSGNTLILSDGGSQPVVTRPIR